MGSGGPAPCLSWKKAAKQACRLSRARNNRDGPRSSARLLSLAKPPPRCAHGAALWIKAPFDRVERLVDRRRKGKGQPVGAGLVERNKEPLQSGYFGDSPIKVARF